MYNNKNTNTGLTYDPSSTCIVKTIYRKDLVKLLNSFNTNSIKLAVYKDYPIIHLWNDSLHADFKCQQSL